MDFERKRYSKIITYIEAALVIAFFIFTLWQIKSYFVSRRKVPAAVQEVPVVKKDDPVDYSYKGEHPYSSVDLPYDLVSLTIETDDGQASFTNGKSAGINIDVTEIKDGDTVTAVGLNSLGTDMISMSATGASPSLNVRYEDGYSIRVSLDHAIQASFDKDGTVKIYNLNKDDDFDITYMINADSPKYPGSTRFTISGTALKDGAISASLTGSVFRMQGIPFNKGMLSDKDKGYGLPASGGSGFFSHDFKVF